MRSSPNVIVIGSGVGGGTLANRLVQHGLTVTMLERGGFLPQEPDNWSVNAVFFEQKYVPQETWLDKEGAAFRPGTYYYVGGSSKLIWRRIASPSRTGFRGSGTRGRHITRLADHVSSTCALLRPRGTNVPGAR